MCVWLLGLCCLILLSITPSHARSMLGNTHLLLLNAVGLQFVSEHEREYSTLKMFEYSYNVLSNIAANVFSTVMLFMRESVVGLF